MDADQYSQPNARKSRHRVRTVLLDFERRARRARYSSGSGNRKNGIVRVSRFERSNSRKKRRRLSAYCPRTAEAVRSRANLAVFSPHLLLSKMGVCSMRRCTTRKWDVICQDVSLLLKVGEARGCRRMIDVLCYLMPSPALASKTEGAYCFVVDAIGHYENRWRTTEMERWVCSKVLPPLPSS